MIENIHRIKEEGKSQILSAPTSEELDRLRVHYLGKKGLITGLLHQLKDLDPDRRREMGAVLNQLKVDFERELELKQKELHRRNLDDQLSQSKPIDVTLPGHYSIQPGSLHPVTRVTESLVNCLKRIGFSIASGPEVETEFFNFEALNTPENHPARDMQDTFYLEGNSSLLRSHTSPVQVRTMKSTPPPLQIISLGKVYRSDYDATHTPMFHQMECLMVDENISMGDLKGILHYLVKQVFGSRSLRFRPSFFPFTEPSAEVDMQCIQCKGNGRDCRLCGSTGWLEIGGCGMVHPNVFRAVDYDTDRYTGFAFGLGIDRIAMLRYGIDDLRSLFENDLRMLEQF